MTRHKTYTYKAQPALRNRLNTMFLRIIPGVLSFFLVACEKPGSIIPPQDVSSFVIGQNYGGGKIFYIDKSGMHGLIASSSDQSTGTTYIVDKSIGTTSIVYNLVWDYVTTNATSTTDGSKNTTMIINVQGNQGVYAANLCRDYNGGGFIDWFLPSKDQLNELYIQKTIIGGFADFYYWSSTEFDNNNAWSQVFGGILNGNQYHYSKGLIGHVRAIRAF